MATIFPTSPAPQVNDEYQGYRYNGVSWDIIGIDLTADYQLKITGVSDTEIGHLDGVTSSIQTQINSKLSSSTASSTYQPIVSGVSDTEIGYLDGVTSSIQTQINSKSSTSHNHTLDSLSNVVVTGTPTDGQAIVWDTTTSKWVNETVVQDLSSYQQKVSGVSDTEISYLDGVTSAVQTQINSKAPTASPTFTGTASAPTAAVDTNSTQLATTAFVLNQAGDTSPIVNGTAAAGTSERYSRANHVHPTDTSRAPTASPTFTGTASAPTAAVDTNTTQLATTAFVLNQAGDTSPIVNGTAAAGTSERYSRANHVHPTDTSRSATSHGHDYLPLAGGTITGQLNLADNVVLNLGTNGWIDLDDGGYINFSNDDILSYNDSTNTYSFGADGNSSGGAILADEFLTSDNAGSETDPAFASPQGTSGMYFVGGATITGIRFTVNGTVRYQITSAGGANVSTLNTKDNIQTHAVPTEDLLNIRTISYHPKGDEREDIIAFGVIAEELDEVPSLRIFLDYEEDGSPISVQYDRIALALINVVKEQQERIDSLEQRLTALENHG